MSFVRVAPIAPGATSRGCARKGNQVNQQLAPKTLDDTRLAELVVSAQSGCQAAQHELMAMAEKFKNNFVVKLARRNRLTSDVIEDAQQEGVFWVLEAIQCYDAERTEGEAWASLITFVHRVISFRFKDFVRRRRRVERREPLISSVIDIFRLVDERGAQQVVDPELADPKSVDPAQVAELRESTASLNQTLSQLDEHLLRLWRLLASGMRLGPIAEQLGISYEAVRRRRRRLLADVKSHLEERSLRGAP